MRYGIIIVLFIANYITCNVSDNKMVTIKQDQPYKRLLDILLNSTTKVTGANSTKYAHKKWHVGRVSRKQYELINMLWRKTKIFINADPTSTYQCTTAIPRLNFNGTNKIIIKRFTQEVQDHPMLTFIPRPALRAPTPSFIEFYYLNEERIQELTTIRSTRNTKERTRNFNQFPIFALRFNNPNFLRSTEITRYNIRPTNRQRRQKNDILIPRKYLNSSVSYTIESLEHNNKTSFIVTNPTKMHTENMTVKIETATKTGFLTNFTVTDYTIGNETCPLSTDYYTTLAGTDKVNENSPIFSPNMSIGTPNISFITPNMSIVTPNISFVTHNISIITPNISFVTPNMSVITPNISFVTSNMSIVTYSTPNDKVRFFETYDKPTGNYDDSGHLIYKEYNDNEINNAEKVLLEHVDYGIGNEPSYLHKVKHSKKHILGNNKTNAKDLNTKSSVEHRYIIRPVQFTVARVNTKFSVQQPLSTFFPIDSLVTKSPLIKSEVAKWSDYPFVAVYIYEPSQVRCDAAGISPHWLITSASCLSRHHKNPGGQGRSAFISYCSGYWWTAERIAYVKYSIIHPRYHPRDKRRKYLYNIGLIQVVTSMASACYGWSPILIMSHQFASGPNGSAGSALGWGLNRFDSRYSSNVLPKIPLSVYKSRIYSDSCPGNVSYKEPKHLMDESGLKNVYCLALPPYLGEKQDPIHGGMLMSGGKLVALYLQEERRPWGQQSAQYTGTWRLIPWVLDVAKEPESDSFSAYM